MPWSTVAARSRIQSDSCSLECKGARFTMVGWQVFGLYVRMSTLDLSRFRAAPGARLSHLPFKSDRAFPTQC